MLPSRTLLATIMMSPLAAIASDSGTADRGTNFINQIFGGLQGNGPLAALFANFNAAILTVASLVVAYTILKSSLETAHDGEVLGKKLSSIWIPIRASTGIGLLLPLSNGFSLVQVMVLWLGILGGDIATGVWDKTTDFLLSEPSQWVQEKYWVPENKIKDLAASVTENSLCLLEHNKSVANSSASVGANKSGDDAATNSVPSDGASPASGSANNAVNKVVGGMYSIMNDGKSIWFGEPGNKSACGRVDLNEIKGSPSQQVALTAHNQATETMISAIVNGLAPMVNNDEIDQIEVKNIVQQAIEQYKQYFDGQLSSIAGQNAIKQASQQLANDLRAEGWIGAGSLYIQAGATKNAIDSASQKMPATENPGVFGQALDGVKSIASGVKNFLSGTWDVLKSAGDGRFFENVIKQTPIGHFDIKNATDHSAGNPLMAMKSLGDYMIGIAEGTTVVLTIIIAAPTIATLGVAAGIPVALGWIMQWLMMLVGIIMFMGLTLSIYLPMMPYILWTAGVIGWLIFLFEAVLAAPIVAVGITHPEGHDAWGKGEPAINLLLGLTMRPVLMVFGMTGAVLISSAGAWLVNKTFFDVVYKSMSAADSMFGLVSMIGFFGVYVSIMIMIMYKSYGMIHVVPDKILRWIGGGHEQLGEGEAESRSHNVFVDAAKNTKNRASSPTDDNNDKDKKTKQQDLIPRESNGNEKMAGTTQPPDSGGGPGGGKKGAGLPGGDNASPKEGSTPKSGGNPSSSDVAMSNNAFIGRDQGAGAGSTGGKQSATGNEGQGAQINQSSLEQNSDQESLSGKDAGDKSESGLPSGVVTISQISTPPSGGMSGSGPSQDEMTFLLNSRGASGQEPESRQEQTDNAHVGRDQGGKSGGGISPGKPKGRPRFG